jgi:hypothetical protein
MVPVISEDGLANAIVPMPAIISPPEFYNQSDLISAATTEKQALIERLRIYLDSTSRKSLLEKKALEAESQQKTINYVPMTIFIG